MATPEEVAAVQQILANQAGLPQVAVDPSGQPRNNTSLPDMVANNPRAYAQIVGMQKQSPLEWARYFGEGAQPVAANNGLILYTRPNKKAGAAAALGADILNAQGQRRLEDVLGVPKDQQSSQLGQLGDIANAALDYMLKNTKWGQGAGAGTTTPASESGAGRMGRGPLPDPQGAGQANPTASVLNGMYQTPSGGVGFPADTGHRMGSPIVATPDYDVNGWGAIARGQQGGNNQALAAILGALGGLIK